jgi:large subunit ribosomal protein L21
MAAGPLPDRAASAILPGSKHRPKRPENGAGTRSLETAMYAIIDDGGKQYRVSEGDTIYVETRELPPGAKTIEFDRVLMLGEGAKSKVGSPHVAGAKVTATLAAQVRGPKLEIVKFKRRKGYRLHKGHRQNLLKVTIDRIAE